MHATETYDFADHIENEIQKIWQFPMWWFGLPGILKGWVDPCLCDGADLWRRSSLCQWRFQKQTRDAFADHARSGAVLRQERNQRRHPGDPAAGAARNTRFDLLLEIGVLDSYEIVPVRHRIELHGVGVERCGRHALPRSGHPPPCETSQR